MTKAFNPEINKKSMLMQATGSGTPNTGNSSFRKGGSSFNNGGFHNSSKSSTPTSHAPNSGVKKEEP